MSDSFKVLYNNCYGSFNLSDAFVIEYEARANKKITALRLKDGAESIRCDPFAIAIFEEKGSEWCSGSDSMLDVREVPRIFKRYWEIDEYLGDEHVRIIVNDALADILHTFIQSGDRVTLDQQYDAILKGAACIYPSNVDASDSGCT